MNHTRTTINPFFAARRQRVETSIKPEPLRPIYARLPIAPKNASPVPHLTSLYHFDRAGDYGDRSWPGNCGGNLIKDLLNYFKPSMTFDPMAGSGTARDVCEELRIPCFSFDIHQGFDACDPRDFPEANSFGIHLGSSAILETEGILSRFQRSQQSTQSGGIPASLPTVHSQLRPVAETCRQAGHSHG